MFDQPSSSENFTWLHLTDLHAGMQNQNWLWPNVKQLLFDDLAKLNARVGKIDTVIFSGDLTQKGGKNEFDILDSILLEIWGVFRGFGFSPSLFVLPGNHDIARPAKLKPEHQVLKKWWDIPAVHEDFFGDSSSVYKLSADELLSEYQDWMRRIGNTYS